MQRASHFYDLCQSDDEGNFSARQFGNLPEFCKPQCKEGNPSVFTYIDGWEGVPTGDVFADFETGRKYAEMTVAYARQIGSATFISFVLESITLKKYLDSLTPGAAPSAVGIECGFFHRLAQITICGSLN
jgi:hypothetical protein